MDKLLAQFEGEPGRDYKLAFYLAPPLLAKRDEHGHPKKRRFGQWTLTMLRVLEKFRFLLGTAFDVFGKTEERRNERELIEQYFARSKSSAHRSIRCGDEACQSAGRDSRLRSRQGRATCSLQRRSANAGLLNTGPMRPGRRPFHLLNPSKNCHENFNA